MNIRLTGLSVLVGALFALPAAATAVSPAAVTLTQQEEAATARDIQVNQVMMATIMEIRQNRKKVKVREKTRIKAKRGMIMAIRKAMVITTAMRIMLLCRQKSWGFPMNSCFPMNSSAKSYVFI